VARKRLTRQESQLQTRERLLQAAAEVFSRRGFYEASVDEVAEEAGFSKGAVYANFASKEELFLALLDRHLAAEFGQITAQFTQTNSQGEGENALQPQSFAAHFATHLEENRTWNVLANEFMLYALRHPTAQQQLAERYRMARNRLTTLLQERYQTENTPSTLNAEYIAWALLGLGNGLALQAYLEPGAMPTDLYSKIVACLLSSS